MQRIERILISRMKFIGDVVLTTPVVHALRETFPDAHISYLAERGAVSLLENNPDLDELIAFDFDKPGILEQFRVIRRLRKGRFDVFIDLFSNPRTALLARASGATMRIGKEVTGRGRLYTHQIRDNGRPKTSIEYHYQYVEPLGVKPAHWRTKIFLTEDEKREAAIYLRWQNIDPEKKIIGLHPGATWPAKMWPAERFADLIDLLNAKSGAQVVVTQGPKDGEVVEKISRRAVGNAVFLNVLPLRQLGRYFLLCAFTSQMTAGRCILPRLLVRKQSESSAPARKTSGSRIRRPTMISRRDMLHSERTFPAIHAISISATGRAMVTWSA